MKADCAIVEFWEEGHRRYFVETALRGGFPGKVLTSIELWSQLPEDLRTMHANQFVVLYGVHHSHLRQARAIRRFRRENPQIRRLVCMFLDDLYRGILLLGALEFRGRGWLRGLDGLVFGYGKYYAAANDRQARAKLWIQVRLLRMLSVLTRNGRLLVHDDVFRAYLVGEGIRPEQIAFVPDPVSPRAATQPLGVEVPPSNKATFGFFGAHAPRKGTTWSLDVLASSGLSVRVIVGGSFGGDPLLPEVCLRAAKQIEVATCLTPAGIPESELLYLMARVDVVVLPYRGFFGSSNVLVHALRLGKRVLVTDNGVIGARVRHLGCGLCFPEGDSAAFLRGVEAMANSRDIRPAYRDEGAVAAFLETCTPAAFAKVLAGS